MSIFYQAGRYNAKVTAQALSQAGTGTPQFVLKVKILERDTGEAVTAQYERSIFMSITANTMPYFVKSLKTLGYTQGSFDELDPGNRNHQSFVGQDVVVYCQIEQAQDNTERERWAISNSNGGELDLAPLAPNKLRELNNLFGKTLRTELGGKAPATSTPGPKPVERRRTMAVPEPHAPTSDEIDSSDIPF